MKDKEHNLDNLLNKESIKSMDKDKPWYFKIHHPFRDAMKSLLESMI